MLTKEASRPQAASVRQGRDASPAGSERHNFHTPRYGIIAAIAGVEWEQQTRLGPAAGDAAQEAPEMMNRIREVTGIYGLGFNKSSVMGLVLPLAIVGGIAVLSVLVFFVL